MPTDPRTPEGVNKATGEIVPIGPFNPYAAMVHEETDSWMAVHQATRSLAVDVATSELVPEAVRGDANKTLALILYGRELGLPPLTSLKNVFIIKGRASVYAETMRAMIIAKGHRLRFEETTDTRCVVSGCRREDDPAVSANWTRYEFTMNDANRSGDAARNQNYRSRPKDMLIARATTGLARLLFADVIGGMASVEEAVSRDDDGFVDAAAAAKGPAAPSPAPAAPAPVRRTRSRVQQPVQAPADVVDAEIVPDGPVAGSVAAGSGETPSEAPRGRQGSVEAPAAAGDGPRIPTSMLGGIAAQMARLGYGDPSRREEPLEVIARLVGHPVGSSKDLSREEGTYLLNQLSRVRDERALEALLAMTTADPGRPVSTQEEPALPEDEEGAQNA